jgi:hypothetical protein
MRKWVYTGMAAAIAVLTILPVATAAAAPARAAHDVLTIGKVRGANVKVKAVLRASLKPKSKAIFSVSSPTLKATLSCKKSTVTEKVTKNPRRPGSAQVSLTKQTFGSCSISIAGAKVKSIKLNKLPYKVAISDKKHDPVTVSRPSTSFVAVDGTLTIGCTYKAKTIKGSASNKRQLITFSKQKFTFSSGNKIFCPKTGSFSATYGPVVDTSVKHHPHVFVN